MQTTDNEPQNFDDNTDIISDDSDSVSNKMIIHQRPKLLVI